MYFWWFCQHLFCFCGLLPSFDHGKVNFLIYVLVEKWTSKTLVPRTLGKGNLKQFSLPEHFLSPILTILDVNSVWLFVQAHVGLQYWVLISENSISLTKVQKWEFLHAREQFSRSRVNLFLNVVMYSVFYNAWSGSQIFFVVSSLMWSQYKVSPYVYLILSFWFVNNKCYFFLVKYQCKHRFSDHVLYENINSSSGPYPIMPGSQCEHVLQARWETRTKVADCPEPGLDKWSRWSEKKPVFFLSLHNYLCVICPSGPGQILIGPSSI